MIEFNKRASVTRLSYAVLRRWKSKCNRYAVVEVKSTLEDRTGYLAVLVDADKGRDERVISRHRSKKTAEKGCGKHERNNQRRS